MNGANFRFTGIRFKDSNGAEVSQIISGEQALIEIDYEIKEKLKGNLILAIGILDGFGNTKATFVTDEMGKRFENIDRSGTFYLKIPKMMLRADGYTIRLFASLNTTQTHDVLDTVENAAVIQMLPGDYWKSGKLNRVGNYSLMDAEFYN